MKKSIITTIIQVALLSFGFTEKLMAGKPAPPAPNPNKNVPPPLPGTPIDQFEILLVVIGILTAFYFLKYNTKKAPKF